MKRNLISFSILDCKEYKYADRHIALKIIKGSLVVMKSDLRKPNRLHYLRSKILGTTTHII